MQVKPGVRLRSAVDATEVVVVRARPDAIDLCCGGHPMLAIGEEGDASGVVQPGFDEGTLIGKRYADEELGLELLCTKPGAGSLSVAHTLLPVKGAKPLPSSD
jgi:hypothetical protein